MVAEAGVLVTRPEGQAEALLALLRAAGYRPVHQPLLTLEPVSALAPAQGQYLQDLDRFQHVIFISANAVRFGMACIENFWPQLPVGIHWYAIGEATAALLVEHGVTPITPGDAMSSEGLLAVPELERVAGQRVLIVKGEGGRATLRQTLVARGASVDELACYRRRCPELAPGALATTLQAERIDAIMVSSGEGLQNLLTLLSREETTKFRHICLVVPSMRVAGMAREAGFEQICTAANASDAAMLAALQQWRSGE
jgi:uroporphyrinogen-III synthase